MGVDQGKDALDQLRRQVVAHALDDLEPGIGDLGRDIGAARRGQQRIGGARLECIEGMGHDLPPQLVERILALIDSHARGKMLPNSTPRLFVKQ